MYRFDVAGRSSCSVWLVIASMMVADLGPRAVTLRPPKPGKVPGLRSATVGITSPLGETLLPRLQFGRAAFVSFWDDPAALDAFIADSPMAAQFADGFRMRMEPLRAYGAWPGLPDDVRRSRAVETEGPAAVITIARLKIREAYRFFKTSAVAEERVVRAPGLVWATGFGRIPVVATCSLWESAQAAADYAYDDEEPAHSEAIDEDRRKTFHKEKAFIRFQPTCAEGSLEGKNPLPANWLG